MGVLLREDGTYSSSIFIPKQAKYDRASGPLHWLILLFGMLFPKISSWLIPLLPLEVFQMSSSLGGFPGQPS